MPPAPADLRRAARAAFASEDDQRLTRACEAVLRAAPQDAEARRLLGRAALRDARPERAEPWFREAAARAPYDPGAWGDLARALVEQRRVADAEAILAAAASNGVRSASMLVFLGGLRERLGRRDDARAAYEAAIDADPMSGEAHRALAYAGGLSADEPRAARLSRLVGEGALTPAAAAAALFALAEAERRSGHGEAFMALLAQANARQLALWGRRKDPAGVGPKRLARLVTAKTLEAAARAQPAPFTPVFIIGLREGGQEHLARALAAHPDMADAGAFNLLGGPVLRAFEALTGRPAPEGFERLDAAQLDAIAAIYVERARRLFPDARAILDASLETDPLLGLVAVALPNARIIRLRRDPMDQGFAVYRRWHASGAPHTCDLAAIARRSKRFDWLGARMDAALGAAAIETRFERLVDHPAAELARLLAHCGVEPAPECARRFARSVAEASADDVEPGAGRDAWRPYADSLHRLSRALGRSHDAYQAEDEALGSDVRL